MSKPVAARLRALLLHAARTCLAKVRGKMYIFNAEYEKRGFLDCSTAVCADCAGHNRDTPFFFRT